LQKLVVQRFKGDLIESAALFEGRSELRMHLMDSAVSTPVILIVDDDPVSGFILGGYLRPINYDVHFVDNPKMALKAARELSPALILLDIMMPAMSGLEVCESLKNDATTQHIPVLFISSLPEGIAHRNAIESGADGFLAKPFDEDFVRAYVKTFARINKEDRRIFYGRQANN